MGSLRDFRADAAAESREKAAADAIGYDIGSAQAPRPGEMTAKGQVADAAASTSYVDPNDPAAMAQYAKATGDVLPGPSGVGVPPPLAKPRPSLGTAITRVAGGGALGAAQVAAQSTGASKIAGGVGKAGTNWNKLADEVRAKYPNVAKRIDQAAGVAKEIAPAMPGFGGTVAAAGNAATAEKRPGAPEEAGGVDEAQALSDRAKALAGQGGGPTGGGMQLPSTPMRTIPGHWQDATRVTKESQLTPEDAESVRTSAEGAQGERALGIEHLDEAAKQKAATDAAYSKWRNDFERQNVADVQTAAAQRENVLKQRMSNLDQTMSRYDASVHDLSKARQGLFANKAASAPAAATAIFGALSLGVGIFSSITGKTNPIAEAVKMLDESAQKDIDAQEKVVNAAGDRVGLARNAFGEAYRALGDKDAAREAVRESQFKYAAAQADMMMGQAKDEETKAKLSDMKAALLDQAAESRAKVAQLTNAQVTRDERYVPTQTVGGGPQMHALDVKPGQIVGRPSGGQVAVRSEQEGEKIRERQGFEKDVGGKLRAIAELDKNATLADLENPYSDYHRQRSMLVEQTLPVYSKAEGQGIIRDFEREPTMKALGSHYTGIDKLMGRKPVSEAAAGRIGAGSEELINAQHGVGVSEQIVLNPKTGKYEQVYLPTEQDAQARPAMPSSAKKVAR